MKRVGIGIMMLVFQIKNGENIALGSTAEKTGGKIKRNFCATSESKDSDSLRGCLGNEYLRVAWRCRLALSSIGY